MAALPEGDPAPSDGRLPNVGNLKNKPFSLYVHVPYCSKRCGYCDFNTYTPSELDRDDQIDSWLQSAIKETVFARKILSEELTVDTIFFGGGTPSLLDASVVKEFLNNVSKHFTLKKDLEITLEANPDTITQTKAKGWRKAGINRISLGMQSSAKNVLQVLDRTHNPANVLTSVEILKKAGFDNFSLDLIYGTPGESLEDWSNTLKDAIAINPPHISAYSLVIEPGTKMGSQLSRGEIKAVSDDDAADKYQLAEKMLTENGYSWYEISNWAKENKECQHNLNYWKGNNWWGVGPGAHSHINGVRWWNQKLPKNWRESLDQDQSPALARENLTNEQIRNEEVMLLSRLKSGIDKADFDQKNVEKLIKDKLVNEVSGKLALTLEGRLLADVVFRQLTA
jgi:putative oxygen-independent coproporphyrinogen III oxidase